MPCSSVTRPQWVQCLAAPRPKSIQLHSHIDGFVQDSSNSIAHALELMQSCIKQYCHFDDGTTQGPSHAWCISMVSVILVLTQEKSIPSQRFIIYFFMGHWDPQAMLLIGLTALGPIIGVFIHYQYEDRQDANGYWLVSQFWVLMGIWCRTQWFHNRCPENSF